VLYTIVRTLYHLLVLIKAAEIHLATLHRQIGEKYCGISVNEFLKKWFFFD
jgi:hypothetical protein